MGLPKRDHITVIDPGVRHPEVDAFNQLCLLSPLPLTLHMPALHGTESLKREGDDLKGIVIVGSASSVHEARDWQLRLADWIRERSGVPLLGLCFGHQLVAHLFGGLVDFVYTDNRKLSGFREVEILETAVWGAPTRGDLAVSHREAVVSCPPEMQVIARSAELRIEGLAHKTLPIWTLQPHPEATELFLENQGIRGASADRLTFGTRLVRDFLRFAAGGAAE